jgi:hypothetical protein
MQNLAAVPDTDPRVQKLYERMREVWDNAPTVTTLTGRTVKLPGYIVPLELGKEGLREFLLVPYFGACLHTPPPPANQIVHVRLTAADKSLRAMDTVWASGTLGLGRSDTEMGVSGYVMTSASVKKFRG